VAFAHAFAAWSDYVARVQRCNRHDLHNIRSAVSARAGLPPITFGRRVARNVPAPLALQQPTRFDAPWHSFHARETGGGDLKC